MKFIPSRKYHLYVFAVVIFTIGLLIFGQASAATGVPQIINFQGRLLDNNGNLLGGTSGTNYCFRFSIYDSSTGGTKLWPSGTPSTMTISVRQGVFDAGIGDTSAGGDVLNYDFQSNNTIYVNVDVAAQVSGSCTGVTFETLTPRQQILSSGYAINSGTIDGFTAAQSASGSQVPALTSDALVLGGASAALRASGTTALTIQGGGATGNIQFFSSSNTLSSSGALTLAGGLTASTINGNTFTAGTGTLTIAAAKTLTASNTLTLTGTDGSSVAFGTGGTVAYTANNLSVFAATTSAQLAGVISDETGTGSVVFGTSPTIKTPTIADSTDATKNIQFSLSGMTTAKTLTLASSQSTSQTLTIPNITGSDTLATLAASQAFTNKTYNGLTLTSNSTGFAVAGGTTSKTLTVSNTLTLAGTDSSTLNIGSGGTLGSNAFTSTTYAPLASPTFTGTVTIPALVLNGLPTGTGVSATATVSTLASRDANGNLGVNNILQNYTTTATAAGTTTLTVSSSPLQFFTGTTTQTVTLPVVSTLVLGQQYSIANNSTGAVTVQSSGSNTVVVLAPASDAVLTVILTSGTTAASWDVSSYDAANVTSGKVETFNNSLTFSGTDGTTMTFPSTSATLARTDAGNTFIGHQTIEGVTSTGATGTGNLVFATNAVLTTPNLGTPSALVGTNITGTASGLTAGNVTTDANLSGVVTSTGNTTSFGTFASSALSTAVSDKTGTGSLVFGTTPTLATPVINGLPTGTGVASAATASTLVSRDSNGNITTNNFINSYATTAMAGGTTALTAGSAYEQYFTGSSTTAQTVTLPSTAGLVVGEEFFIANTTTGTGALTIETSTAAALATLAPTTSATCTVISTAGNTAAAWNVSYKGDIEAAGKSLTTSNTLTLAGTDGSTLNVGTGGTLGTAAYTASSTYGLVANPLSQFASTTSAQLAGVISDETGSGSLVFGTSPSISGATITTSTVNGVTLTTGGTATTFLNGAGSYVAPFTLTTTGTSGAATFSGGTLNIPQYTGGGATYTFSTGLTNASNTITNNLSTGVSGGQSVFGGTGLTDALTLVGTTGNGTTTANAINFDVGNNGGTQAMTILNNGNVGLGIASPTYMLDVRGTTAANGIRSAMGYDIYPVPDPTAPTGVVSSGGSVDSGTHWYGVTYTTAVGETHEVQTAAVITTTSGNNTVTLTIPVSTDPRVTGRKIYRTKAGGGNYQDYLLATVSNNTATSYVDTAADSTLTGSVSAGYYRTNTTSKGLTIGGGTALTIDQNATYIGIGDGATVSGGGRDVFVGASAGSAVTTGTDDDFIGQSAGGGSTVTGSHDVYIGSFTGGSTTSGGNNTGVGYQSLWTVAGGGSDTAYGYESLESLTSGGSDVAVGNLALSTDTTGTDNTAVGMNALLNLNITNSTGANTAVGYNTGLGIVTGVDDTIIGANVTGLSSSLSNNIIIADGAGNQRINIGSSGLVGLGGVATPTSLLDLGGSVTAAAWGLNGINFQTVAETFTDSSSAAGTVTNNMVNTFGIPTLATSTNTVTYTNAATVYIAGAPANGSHVTVTNPYALDIAGGNSVFGGNLGITTGNTTQTGASAGLSIIGNSLTSGTGASITSSATGITTAGTNVGSLLDVTESGSMTSMTGQLVNINASGTNTSGSTGSALNINLAGTGQIMKAINVTDATTGALANGIVRFNFTGAHTANGLEVDDVTTTGNIVQITGSALTSGNALAVTGSGTTNTNIATFTSGATGTGTNILILKYSGLSTEATTNAFARFENSSGTTQGVITGTGTTGNVAYTTTSDARVKHDITETHYGLEDLLNVNVDDYVFNADPSNTIQTGFIAQQLDTVFPDAVATNGDNGIVPLQPGEAPWSVDYGRVTPLIVKAVQDQQGLLGTFTLQTDDLSNLISDAQGEMPHDPVAIIQAKITAGTQFLEDFVSVRVTAIRGYFDEIFANKVHSNQICLKKSDGTEICIDGDQLQGILNDNGIDSSGGGSSQTPTPSTPAPSDNTSDSTQTPDDSTPAVTPPSSNTSPQTVTPPAPDPSSDSSQSSDTTSPTPTADSGDSSE